MANNVSGYNASHDEPIGRSERPQQHSSPPHTHSDYPQSHSHLSSARSHPSAHPDSAFNRLRIQRAGEHQDLNTYPVPPMSSESSNFAGPPPPLHSQRRPPTAQDTSYPRLTRTTATATSGRDHLGPAAAAGGIAGTGVGLAHSPNGRQRSGLDAMSGAHDDGMGMGNPQYNYGPSERGWDGNGNGHTIGSDYPYGPSGPGMPPTGPSRMTGANDSYSSNIALGAAMDGPGQTTPGQRSLYSNNNGHQQWNQYGGAGGFYDDPYVRPPHSSWGPVKAEHINPNDILDDGDDGFMRNPQRRSILSLGRNSSHNSLPAGAAPAAPGGAILKGNLGRVQGPKPATSDPPDYDVVSTEKSEWLNNQKNGNKKLKWIVGIIIALVVVGAIVGGVVGGVLNAQQNRSGGGGGGNTADQDLARNGDLGKDSAEIKNLMAMNGLHKVFPGIDYTPWGTQYPLCLQYPPSQNNVTRDIAVLSKLTNTVRLYGTDCNQTEMVLHAFNRLELTDMKLWLGVWIDNNATTNDRQIEQLYKIIQDTKDKSVFKGVIVGNEVLFRGKDGASTLRTIPSLKKYIESVKSRLTELNVNIPVATSDLGDNWTSELVSVSDVVMANVHPFFAGVTVAEAAAWTWNFWQEHNVPLTKGTSKQQIISEVGWPSGGGNNCSPDPCPDRTSGSVAGVEQLNQFMESWVCQSLLNGTNYFWFEAFDEPWKVIHNEPGKGKEWEDKWGLMDPGRNLKAGLKIPDCGGKTAS
ncbi:hypothetical protein PABG_03901 [Paracoccidioides brasiliensis Pb03]|nr:hypothetical protein PABG_03901 [Paracoccidioides brasiliensis Pb03]